MGVSCDPHLLQMMLEERQLQARPGDPGRRVGVIARLADPVRPVPGLDVVVRAGSIVTGRINPANVLSVRADPNVISLKRSRLYVPPDDFSDRDGRASPGREPRSRACMGRGSVIGFADWGFDFAHDDFRDTAGHTRFLYLWDQRDIAGGTSPSPYGYGREFDRAAIDNALATPDPYATLGYDPAAMDRSHRGMHGTHTLGIACGNGRAPSSRPGVAPEAEIIAVHLRGDDTSPSDTLGDSARILEAVDYILRRAGELPVAINLSLGRCGGPHDSSPLIVQGVDSMLDQAPGRAIVMSAGNYYGTRQHASAQLMDGRPTTWEWTVAAPLRHPAELEIWYDATDSIVVALASPDGTTVFELDGGDARVSAPERSGDRVGVPSSARSKQR